MVFSELDPRPLDKLSRDDDKGLILEDGKRIISFRMKTFQNFVDQLASIAGTHVAKVLLYTTGLEIGRTGLHYSRDEIKSEQDLGRVLDRVLRLRGWGRCFDFDKKEEYGRSVYAATMSNCPVCYDRKTERPSCDLMRGVLAGWIGAYLEKSVASSVEKECAAVSGHLCVFEIGFTD